MISLYNIILILLSGILSELQLCLAGGKGTNSIDKSVCIIAASTREAYTGDTCINSICAMNTQIGCVSDGSTCTSSICAKCAFVKSFAPDIRLRILLGLVVIFISPNIKN